MNTGLDRAAPPSTRSVELIGAGLDYADGAEDELLTIMEAAVDRSSGSDELVSAIRDWPTKYHLSPQRSNLLLPIRLEPGMRVLDVGCGTGALTRRIAESGAEVIGLEGSPARARVAAARVAGLDNARILAGSLEDYLRTPPADAPKTFDLVVACGVLEYSGAHIGGSGSATAMLAQVRGLLGETGTLALAIENRWGLKYLLSAPEDHLGRPWVGVEGYWHDRSGITTWSRRELAGLLTQGGLSEQTWFAAYPDYKLPMTLVREEMFADDDSLDLVKLFVRTPTSGEAGEPVLSADSLSAFHSALDAGLGLELANSFLVLAGPSAVSLDLVRPPSIHLGVQGRAKAWRQARSVVKEPSGWRVGSDAGAEAVEHWPLRVSRRETNVHPGTNAEDLIADALLNGGLGSAELAVLLQRWWHEAEEVLSGVAKSGGQFDVLPRNFVVSQDDVWEFVDDELEWLAPLAAEVAGFRALMWTAAGLATRVALIPGCPASTTVFDLAASLGNIAGIDVASLKRSALLDFESSLQAIVGGDASPAGVQAKRTAVESVLALRLDQSQRGLPRARLMEQVDRLTAHVESADGALREANHRLAQQTGALESALESARSEISRLRAEAARLETGLAASRSALDAVHASRRWRAAEAIRHPGRHLRRRSPEE